MTKEIHDINTKAVDFVVELIDYIFEYPDDDYMTMECLCRKLVKHGLLDKADGYYQTHDKTEPSNSEKPNNSTISKMEQVDKDINVRSKDERQTKGVWNAGYKTGYDKGYKDAQKVKDSQYLVKDLVKAFCEDGTWLERQGVYTLTLAEAKQRAVDIIESVLAKDEPATQTETQNSNLTFEKADEPQTEVTTDCRQTDCPWK